MLSNRKKKKIVKDKVEVFMAKPPKFGSEKDFPFKIHQDLKL